MNVQAHKIAVKIIKNFEGCSLYAYPDPCSPLGVALHRIGKMDEFMAGKLKWKDLDKNFQALSGHPWTIGYGETKGITKDTVWTQEQANTALEARTAEFMATAIKDCPKLAKQAPERIAAITSLAYNIGSDAFKNSTAARRITAEEYHLVDEAIQMWNKDNGKIVQGLVNRRKIEADLWMSGR